MSVIRAAMAAAGVEDDETNESPAHVHPRCSPPLEEPDRVNAQPNARPPSAQPTPLATYGHQPEPTGGGMGIVDPDTFNAATVAANLHAGHPPAFSGYGPPAHVAYRRT